MENIQALRIRHDELSVVLQNLVDKEKNPQWTAEHQSKYDKAMAEMEGVNGKIKAHQLKLEQVANGAMDGAASAPEWHNIETGRKIPVAYAKNGKFGPELNNAFPNREFNSNLPKAGM